jgi:NADPH-dependent curcumin reductase CurA
MGTSPGEIATEKSSQSPLVEAVAKKRTDRSPTVSREVRLVSRPHGLPVPDNFTLVRIELAPPGEDQVLVRNLYMSVDPYMRGRMNDTPSFVSPFQMDQPLEGAAVGEVIESRTPGIVPGDIVTSRLGWRECFVSGAREVRVVDRHIRPLSAHLGALGMTGLTAWAGLNLVGVKAGDRVFISAAAGAVGSIAGQLAKLRGCRVIGSAGSPEKAGILVKELGFDAAFNYKDGNFPGQLNAAAPDGIDVYFDNVGGEQLEAALSAMRQNGRIIACGAIGGYNDDVPVSAPRNLNLVIGKRITIKGFIVGDWFDRMPEFLKEMNGYLAGGKLIMKETVVQGIERAPHAFLDLLRGGNVGKMVVRLTKEDSAILTDTGKSRHIEREGNKLAESGKREMLLPLLGIIDDWEKALALLETQEVRPFDCEGKTFIPDLHEAVALAKSCDVADGTIVEDLRRGYLWRKELLRPAQVRVAG